MPKWKPAPAGLTARFAKALEEMPHAQPRKMFGYLAGFVDGQMFASAGRVMREYVQVPGAAILEPDAFVPWLEKACSYTATLPPKKRMRK